VTLTGADEKVVRRIREGAYRVYPEQRHVDASLMPGCLVTGLFGLFLILPIIVPTSGMMAFEVALIGVLVGLCILLPGIIIWNYYRTTYSYMGLKRFQIALSITALELQNKGHERVQPIISPSYPEEYQYLPLFTSIGPYAMLKRVQNADRNPVTLQEAKNQSERAVASFSAIAGAMAILGGLISLPLSLLIWSLAGNTSPFFFLLAIGLLVLGLGMLLSARRKIKALESQELESGVEDSPSYRFGEVWSERRVEDILSLLRAEYTHPIRILVEGAYEEFEYTGRTYYTGDGIELREAIFMPTHVTY